jgi:hypothetical protein
MTFDTDLCATPNAFDYGAFLNPEIAGKVAAGAALDESLIGAIWTEIDFCPIPGNLLQTNLLTISYAFRRYEALGSPQYPGTASSPFEDQSI